MIVLTLVENGFRLEASDLADAITPRTRWVVVNAPGNPSGATYREADLRWLAAVLDGRPQVRVLSDDIYAHIRFGPGPYVTLAAIAPNLRARILTVDGVFKAYATTGWRVGWGCDPADLIGAMTGIQAQSCTQTSTLSQHAAVAALEGPQGFLEERRETYRRRRDAAFAALWSAPRIRVAEPDGAFYLLQRINGVLDDGALALCLLDTDIATVPGAAFGMPGHLRLSFATDETTLVEGCRRLAAALADPGFGVAS